MSWKNELSKAVRTEEALLSSSRINLSDREKLFFRLPGSRNFAFSVTDYYLSLVENNENDPLRLQCIPRPEELETKSYELSDPLGEDKYKVSARLIHRYRDRVLFLVTDTCAVYCRHCFRRSFTGGKGGTADEADISGAAEYVGQHKEVTEVILSGGDPLVMDTSVVERILAAFKKVRNDIVFRIGTRVPVVLPSRIDRYLVETLKKYSPVYIMTQFNHPREITSLSRRASVMLIDAGIPVFNQTVLLKGVNDDPGILEELFHRLVGLRIKPYYIFQGDLAAGTSHLRVPLGRGLEIMQELRGRISGLAMPVYAVDLPGGGGKVPLTESYIVSRRDGVWNLRDSEGRAYFYPDEDI